jgi:hypothetical protein
MEYHLNRTEQDRTLPFGWWGHRTSPEQHLSVADLLRGGNLDARIAAFLWMSMEACASVVVASTLEDAGKTTMLTALLDFLPPDVETLYLRGWYERFDFLDSRDPNSTYLLCNEISDNLPTYLWGPGVRRLFEANDRGFPLATTLHANGAAEMVDLLTSFPLEVPSRLLGNIDFVLTLSGGSRSSKFLRRLMRVEMIQYRDDDRVQIETIAERDVLLGPLVSRPGRLIGVLTERFGIERDYAINELVRREQFLEHIQRDGLGSSVNMRQALQAFLEK